MSFHAPFALVSIKSGQDLSLGIRLTTFCFSGKVLTALCFPSLRPHASIYNNREFLSEISMVLVRPARVDIVIWEGLIHSCKTFMGTKKEAFASPSSGSNLCLRLRPPAHVLSLQHLKCYLIYKPFYYVYKYSSPLPSQKKNFLRGAGLIKPCFTAVFHTFTVLFTSAKLQDFPIRCKYLYILLA